MRTNLRSQNCTHSRMWVRRLLVPLGIAWHLLATSCTGRDQSAAATEDTTHATPTAEVAGRTPGDSSYAPIAVTVVGRTLSAPTTVAAGWHRMHLTDSPASHVVVAYRIPASADSADVAALMAVIDSARVTPAYARAMGGVEGAGGGDVIIAFTPGRYVLACLSRGDDTHRHALGGEYTTLTVTDDARARATPTPEPQATVQLGLVDFAYTGPDVWSANAGDSRQSHVLRVENTGKQDHQVRIDRLRDGITLRQWLDTEDHTTISQYVGGIARMSPGAVAYLTMQLERGSYVVYCLVPDAATRAPHVELGMLREITVR